MKNSEKKTAISSSFVANVKIVVLLYRHVLLVASHCFSLLKKKKSRAFARMADGVFFCHGRSLSFPPDKTSKIKSFICSTDLVVDPIAPGGTWTASSRGVCLVTYIYAALHIPDPDFPDAAGILECKHYHSSGTSYSQFSIIMDGEDACCVLSSHEKPQTC